MDEARARRVGGGLGVVLRGGGGKEGATGEWGLARAETFARMRGVGEARPARESADRDVRRRGGATARDAVEAAWWRRVRVSGVAGAEGALRPTVDDARDVDAEGVARTRGGGGGFVGERGRAVAETFARGRNEGGEPFICMQRRRWVIRCSGVQFTFYVLH